MDKSRHWMWFGVAAMVAAMAGSAPAGPLDVKRVPADAKWFAHVDVRAAVNSELGKLVLSDLEAMGLSERVRQIQAFFGVDPLKSFDGITLFGKSYRDERAVVIVEAVTEIARLEELVEAGYRYERADARGRVVHSWIEEDGKRKGQRKFAGIYPVAGGQSTLLVLGDARLDVIEAFDLLDGKRPDISESDADVFRSRPDVGSILYVAADDVADAARPGDEHSALLRAARTLIVDFGEQRGDVYVDVQVTTATLAQAQNVRELMRGMLAAVSIAQTSPDQPLARLADAIDVRAAETTVIARFKYPAAPLYALLKDLRQQQDEAGENNGEPGTGTFAAPPPQE